MHSKRKADTVFHSTAKSRRVEEVLNRCSNGLMQLNELGIKDLKWDIYQINDAFPQRFRADCLFMEPYYGSYELIPTGTVFTAEGPSKLACRHEVADQIMKRLSGNMIRSIPKTDSSPQLVKESMVKLINKNNFEMAQIEDAVRLLNEKVSGLGYEYNLIENGFCCFVSFRGFMIKGEGLSKKMAKRNVAVQILKKYFNYIFSDDDIPSTINIDNAIIDNDKLPLSRRKNFSNQIQSMVKTEFERLVSTLELQFTKRKVLAGIVMSRKLKVVFPSYYRQQDDSLTPNVIDPMQFFLRTGWTINADDCSEILKLVTISTGTKCLSGNEINPMGSTVNDCHAEVVSKRALQLFLYRTIDRIIKNVQPGDAEPLFGTDVLEQDDEWTYKLKEDVKFHVYVSSSPCGDSRIFLPQATNNADESEAEDDEDSHPNRKNRGVLRTKIECGEGTIPIKTRHLQTWDGILGGERLRTMSCSDKVCVWNVLGLQGALLSNMLSHPIYMDSITIGSLFRLDHSQRALFERAKDVTSERDWSLNGTNGGDEDDDGDEDASEDDKLEISADNVDVFRVNGPHILTVTEPDERCPGKASNYSGNWILGEDNCLEIVSTTKGLRLDNAPSRLSKRSLFRSFLDVFQYGVVLRPGDGVAHYNDMKSLAKGPLRAMGAVNYQRKKRALFRFFDRQGLGRWIGKPMEQDWFALGLAK